MTASSTRRTFLSSSAAVLAAATLHGQGGASKTPAVVLPRPVALGFDNFSVRASNWKATRLLEYATTRRRRLGVHQRPRRVRIARGSPRCASCARRPRRATSPSTSAPGACARRARRSDRPTAPPQEQLSKAIRTARFVGSPVVRVVLGTWEDRLTPGGIGRHIDSLVAVLKGGRSEALDAGVKVAVENHAGDLRSEELAAVVEMAGRDFVGVNYDSGNSLWTLENPVDALETLAPYIVTTSLRDGVVTEIPAGCRVKWTAMGDGQVDFVRFMPRFAELCPGVPIHIETISGVGRDVPFLEDAFWTAWPRLEAQGLARFLRVMRRKAPMAPTTTKPNDPPEQRRELERSLAYCKTTLGLGPARDEGVAGMRRRT